MTDGVLDEVYERLRQTGPERDGWLSNHAPMAAEALVRHGHGARVHAWLDDYADRLSERPRGIQRISAGEWREPLGDPVRTGDWLTFFERRLTERPWREVLVEWWPRLLPGVAAGATHGVIRVGHAVRALLNGEHDGGAAPARVGELGAGLAYWAARWQPLAPAGKGPYRSTDPRSALDAVPRVPHQRSGIRTRLAQLADLPGWPESAGAVPGDAATGEPDRLAAIVEAAVLRFGTHGHGNPVMLVHAATAPNAIARVLPVLPAALHGPSVAAAWAATAAVTSAYSPPTARPMPVPGATDPADLMARGLHDRDSHGIKFIDAALDVHLRTGERAVLDVAAYANDLIVRG
ncbi:questin oxidase family protein [Catellatospora sp. NPDC049609]|uniref:questin oxidase family protein n=1 Tax=Catellatospora sp. NPDC049609 TaxID=3155505 RepID=UPI003435EC6D